MWDGGYEWVVMSREGRGGRVRSHPSEHCPLHCLSQACCPGDERLCNPSATSPAASCQSICSPSRCCAVGLKPCSLQTDDLTCSRVFDRCRCAATWAHGSQNAFLPLPALHVCCIGAPLGRGITGETPFFVRSMRTTVSSYVRASFSRRRFPRLLSPFMFCGCRAERAILHVLRSHVA